MSNLGAGIQQLILLVLLATFIHLLLPNSGLERYARLVLGLTMVLAILHWLLSWLGYRPTGVFTDFSASSLQQEPTNSTFQAVQKDMVRRQAEKTLAQNLKRHLEVRFLLQVLQAHVTLSSAAVERAEVRVSKTEGGPEVQKHDVEQATAQLLGIPPIRVTVEVGGDEAGK